MAAPTAQVMHGLETNPANLTVGDDKASSPETPSTEAALSDDGLLPMNFTSLHGWLHATDRPRPPLQQPNITDEFQAFREEIRAEMQVQTQRIEGFLANSKIVCEVADSEKTYCSALSNLRAESAHAVSLLQVQVESYESNLNALRADLDDRIGATESMLTAKFEHQVVPKLLDQYFSHEVIDRMEQQICGELLGHFDAALACEAAARQQLERRTLRKFDKLLKPVPDMSRDKQKPVAVDEEDVAEQVTVEDAAKQEVVKNNILAKISKTADAGQFDTVSVPVASSASSARGTSTRGAAVSKGYQAIDETTAVPDDLFESLAMAGRAARNRGQHCRIRCGGEQRLIATELCLDDGSNFDQPKCTAS